MSKAALKAIGELVKQSKWNDAIAQAQSFLQNEPRNFQAHIFLAFALDKKNKLSEAEETYLAAAELRPEDLQPWQGLIKLYQRQGATRLAGYKRAAVRLAELFSQANEMYKCQDVIDKFVEYAKSNGEQVQYAEALDVILPGSPIYGALEGRVPHPAKTYETIAQIVEADEKKRINTLIGERRTRIGARIAEVTVDVKREVLGQSKLGEVYRQLINWTSDDELRRTYEEKLLQHCYDRLLVFPPGSDKTRELEVVQKLANGMVIIKHPFKLAWDIAIDWQDNIEIRQWDVTVLREYCSFFPESDMYKIITGFLTSPISPFPKADDTSSKPEANGGEGDDESEDDEDGGAPTSFVPVTEEDRMLMMTEGINTANSLLGYRLVGEYYQHLEEHESNSELMRKAKDHLSSLRRKTGMKLQNTENALLVYLGTALVYYQTPRNHQEAKALFDSVLERDPTATAALIGVGLIYEEEEEYDDAVAFLERALKRDPTNLRVQSEAAWVKALKGDYAQGKEELEACIPLMEKAGPLMKGLLAQSQYRLGVCIWNLDSSKAARKNRGGAYAQFLAALRNDLNLAPAYTSLGIYYADYSKDKKRARKCFLKAVELSHSEVEAAERLARSFADDSDWDRVELVAQRVVDSGKVKPPPGSRRKGISWPFSALGVAELNKQEYAKAVVSFQSALRIKPDDYHSWVGLGESYYNSGRYIAATKATLNAQRLEQEAAASGGGGAGNIGDSDTWFTKFMLANIKRELSDFDEAISLYKEVSSSRPDEEGVSIALMQAMVEGALHSLENGLFGKAVGLATEALTFAAETQPSLQDNFNFWKAVGDACSIFSSIQGRVTEFPTDVVRGLIGDAERAEYDALRDVDGVGAGVIQAKGLFSDDEKAGVELTRCLHAAILAHKRAVHVSAHDIHARAVAHFNLGWAEHRAHECLPRSLRDGSDKKVKPSGAAASGGGFSSRYLKAAVRCFKRAIELEPGNAEFWDSLGVATSGINPGVAQHAFVRSLYLNERSAPTWANFGALALLRGDLSLANEAFTRAQSADPDYSHAWVGQGFVALLYGDAAEARALFTHAVGISTAATAVERQRYAVSMFDHIRSGPAAGVPIAAILQPVFALSQLRGLKGGPPATNGNGGGGEEELSYSHLAALLQERLGTHAASAVATLEPMCDALEADYETSEAAESLRRFALAKTDLARAYLASGEFEKATECGEMALQLTDGAGGNEDGNGDEAGDNCELSADERNKARLSAHLTLGVAQYYLGAVDESVRYYETALEESGGNPDAVCLLAQVLWATGADDARDQARDRLFEVVEKQPDHVPSVLLLGAIALLDGDAEGLDAVVSELKTLRGTASGATVQGKISDVLQAAAVLSSSAGEEATGVDDAKVQAQVDIMLHPYLPHGWSNLATAISGEEHDRDKEVRDAAAAAAELAVTLARGAVAPRGDLEAADLARTYAGTGKIADAQTAIMTAPWAADGWVALAEGLKG